MRLNSVFLSYLIRVMPPRGRPLRGRGRGRRNRPVEDEGSQLGGNPEGAEGSAGNQNLGGNARDPFAANLVAALTAANILHQSRVDAE